MMYYEPWIRKSVLLVLLDLSAAFDTVDHSRLKACLEQKFDVSDSALRWFKSYMSEKQQAVIFKGIGSEKRTLEYGVPQGSVLGPELFKDYVATLLSLIQSFGVNFQISCSFVSLLSQSLFVFG